MDTLQRLDVILRTLTHQRRRFALYLLQEEGIVELKELARQVAAWEAEKSPEEITEKELQELLNDFHHNHLPMFRDALLIEYDQRSETIRYRDPPLILPKLLDLLATIEHSGESNG